MTESMTLPTDVRLMRLKTHPDHRGELTEIFRNEWHESPLPAQWVACRSEANSLRGVHAHARHWRYLCAIAGEVFVGLHDLRPEEPTARRSAVLHLTSRTLQMLLIPPLVAHGFCSPVESTMLLASSGLDDVSCPHRCRWDSPELGLDWPCTAPQLSTLDRAAGGYVEMRGAILAAPPSSS